MRQLLPEPVPSIDPMALHTAMDRTRPVDRPWIACNMIVSIDGATAVEGRSGPMGGTGDRLVFTALRAAADVILVGAGTVRAEGYGPPRTPQAQRDRRMAQGREPNPRIAVVSGSLDLDLGRPLFSTGTNQPIVITSQASDRARRAEVSEHATVIVAGTERVNVGDAVRALSVHGDLVLCEGGPLLNGQLVAEDLMDEICLTVAPAMAGGDSPRAAHHEAVSLRAMLLAHLWEEDGFLFLRYVRDRQAVAPEA